MTKALCFGQNDDYAFLVQDNDLMYRVRVSWFTDKVIHLFVRLSKLNFV